MMFDPPDFPYKDLNETIKEQYGPEITNSAPGITIQEDKIEHPVILEPANTQINETTLLLNVNDINSELYVVQTENLFKYEPILLDDNTVNEFLLPLQVSDTQTNDESNGPDLLALHSCSICHEIFVSEYEMLEHSTKSHIVEREIDAFKEDNVVTLEGIDIVTNINNEKENNPELGTEWLVCGVCDRVLSTALEIEPIEQLCCLDENGGNSISVRTLQEMYVCEFCNALYADNDAMDKHRAVCNNHNKENFHHENSSSELVTTENVKNVNLCFSCDICGAQNVSMDELKMHTTKCRASTKERRLRNSNYTKMWNCGSCNQLFATARDLYRHKRGEDRPEGAPLTAFVCEECDKVLGSMCALHTHKKMHKVTKPGYPCRVCGRRFNQSGHLAIHMRMHTGERPYPCDLCSKAFKVKVERDDHRRTHTGERPFCCTACPKTFTAAARLREHARIHTDQRPYICDICGAAFRRPYARTVHTLIHTGAKPHECDVCGTAFRRSGDMWKHKRTLHGVTS